MLSKWLIKFAKVYYKLRYWSSSKSIRWGASPEIPNKPLDQFSFISKRVTFVYAPKDDILILFIITALTVCNSDIGFVQFISKHSLFTYRWQCISLHYHLLKPSLIFLFKWTKIESHRAVCTRDSDWSRKRAKRLQQIFLIGRLILQIKQVPDSCAPCTMERGDALSKAHTRHAKGS